MPKYTNSGLTVLEKNGIRLEPGESVTIQEYWQTLPAGVTEDKTLGYYNPIIYSSATATGTITIPATTGAYEIKFVGGAASATIKFNSSDATAQVIAPGETLKEKCLTRVIDSVIITGTVYMTVKKI